MKINIRTKTLLLGATILGTMLLTGATAPAATYTQTVNELNSPPGGDWFGVIWSSGAAATAGNDYITAAIAGTNCGVRTPNVTTNFAFNGDHLIVTNLGCLEMKHASATATANVILYGGQIIFRGANGTGASGLAGTLQVNFNTNTVGRSPSDSGVNFYNLGQDQTTPLSRNILLLANVSGSGNFIVNMNTVANTSGNNVVQIAGTNTAFSGSWTNNRGVLEIESSSVNPLGSGSVTLNSADAVLRFNSTNDLVISNSIYGTGSVTKSNINTVTLTATNSLYSGTNTIGGGVLKIGANSSSSITNSSLISLTGGTLDASLIGGLVLNVASNQQMNCNGSIIGYLAASSDSTYDTNILHFNLSPAANDTLNISGSLLLTNNPMLMLTLNGIKANGEYTLINYSGTIQGGGSFNLIPPAGSSGTFSLNTNTAGQVNLVVSNVTVQNLKWVGDVVDPDGFLDWDTVTTNWTSNTNIFSVGDNVTFDDSGSASAPIDVTSASLYPSSVTVSNTAQIYTFIDFGISTSGSFTKLGTNMVIFENGTPNGFNGPISILAGILSIGNGSFLGGNFGTGPITNNGVLLVNMTAPAVAFNAPISGSGSLEVIGGATVTIGGNGHNTYTGLTTIDGSQLNIATSNALGSTSSGTIVQNGGRLGVTSTVGTMSVAEPVTINGSGITATPGALYVGGDPANVVSWTGPITVGSSSMVRAVLNTRMNFSNTVTGTNVTLTCEAGDPNVIGGSDANTTIFFQNTVSLGSAGSAVMYGVGTVILDGPTNVWGGGTTVNMGTLRVDGMLDGGSVTIGDGTDFATLAGTGTILGPVTVASGSLLSPGSFATPIGTLTVSNSVTLSSGSTNLFELNRANSPNSDQLVASSLVINSGVTLNVVNTGVPVQAGDTFTLFSISGSTTGSFSVTNLPALSSTNLYWNTSLLQSGGLITVRAYWPPTPTNSQTQVVGTNFIFQVAPVGGANNYDHTNYVLQSTPSLNPTVWTNVSTNAGVGVPLSFTNGIAHGVTNIFYRIMVQ